MMTLAACRIAEAIKLARRVSKRRNQPLPLRPSIVGFLGEIGLEVNANSLAQGIDPKFHMTWNSSYYRNGSGDGGWDFDYNGWRIDVKVNHKSIKVPAKVRADIYVNMRLVPPDGDLRKWVYRQSWRKMPQADLSLDAGLVGWIVARGQNNRPDEKAVNLNTSLEDLVQKVRFQNPTPWSGTLTCPSE